MTNTEKEFITFAIVTRDTDVAITAINPDKAHEAEGGKASQSYGYPWGSFMAVVAHLLQKLKSKSLRGSKGPRQWRHSSWGVTVNLRHAAFTALS